MAKLIYQEDLFVSPIDVSSLFLSDSKVIFSEFCNVISFSVIVSSYTSGFNYIFWDICIVSDVGLKFIEFFTLVEINFCIELLHLNNTDWKVKNWKSFSNYWIVIC